MRPFYEILDKANNFVKIQFATRQIKLVFLKPQPGFRKGLKLGEKVRPPLREGLKNGKTLSIHMSLLGLEKGTFMQTIMKIHGRTRQTDSPIDEMPNVRP